MTVEELNAAATGSFLREEIDRNHDGVWGYSEYVKQEDGTWQVIDSDHPLWLFVTLEGITPPATRSEEFRLDNTEHRRYAFTQREEAAA